MMSSLTDTSATTAHAGKIRRLQRLSDADHRFAMLAIDQRGSLRKMLAAKSRIPEDQVPDEALVAVKEIITSAVAPSATAVLTDPLFGYPVSPHSIPPDVGLLLALEVTGYEAANEAERLSRLIDGWSGHEIARSGADAVKLLLWHRHDASPATKRHQQDLVERVGAQCAEEGMPFVLEVVSYPRSGESKRSAAYARVKPEIVIDAAACYSDDRYAVDLLKVEFPGDLKYVEELQGRGFAAGESVYGRDEVRAFCERLNDAAAMPWVLLSAGVDPEEFIENIRLANAAGASGFLCGRAVWKHVVEPYPDREEMRRFAHEVARTNFIRIRSANQDARPWTEHPRFAGTAVTTGLESQHQ